LTNDQIIYKLQKGALDSQPQVIKLTSCLPMVGGSFRPSFEYGTTQQHSRPVVTIKVFHQKLCQRKFEQKKLGQFFYHLCQRIGWKSCKHEKMAPTLTNYENIAVTLCLKKNCPSFFCSNFL
jgi:hypothetical protein